jgi:hypothetical protein
MGCCCTIVTCGGFKLLKVVFEVVDILHIKGKAFPLQAYVAQRVLGG